MKKIAYISHLDFNLYRFRLSWMKELQRLGYEVHAIVPPGEYNEPLRREGIKIVPYPIKRRSLNPFSALGSILSLRKIMVVERYSLVHSFTTKPNVFSGIAGLLSRTPVVNHVTGLGYYFVARGFKPLLVRNIIRALYAVGFRGSDRVIFQNPDDLGELRRLVGRKKSVLIMGTGVDVTDFHPDSLDDSQRKKVRQSLGLGEGTVTVTLIARLLWQKGVREFVEAARAVTAKFPNVEFLIVGWIDEGNPSSVTNDFIKEAGKVPRVHYAGRRDDIRDVLAVTDIYALPSYREGIPRTVLEAMAMGIPIVTTDVPGCRETVEQGVNGFLVPPQDSVRLAEAISRLAADETLRRKMGNASREKAERQFDQRVVIGRVLDVYRSLEVLR